MTTRHLFAVLLLVVCVFSFSQVKSQGTATLHVSDMPGFPDLPQDTAYEQVTYSFDIKLKNNSNVIVDSSLQIMIKVDTTIMVLVANPLSAPLVPGDSTIISVPSYDFTQPTYKVGNNIVVVWPVVNGLVIPVDSFVTIVHFVPLMSLAAIESPQPTFQVYPIPATTTLHLDFGDVKLVEQVRIYAASGQLVCIYQDVRKNAIDISALDKGLYFIDATMKGVSVRRKFLKY